MNLNILQRDFLYDYLSINKDKFIYKKIENDRVYNMNILIQNIHKYIEFNSIVECFNYLTEHWDKKCKNYKCENERKITSLFPNRNDYLSLNKKYGIYKFCDNKECNYKSISERQMGKNNTSLRMSKEKFNLMRLTNSIKMKQKIKNGDFIPCVTNSWAKSRCELSFIRNGELVTVKTRSTWEAYFQLYNKDFLYEKVVIPYRYKDVDKNYIVDFVDYQNRVLYEIKPDSTYNMEVNLCKYKFAKKWCKLNNFKYKVIKNKWFRKNYNEEIVYGQPSEEKIIKNLKQFK